MEKIKILFVNSGIKGIPEGYARGIIASLKDDFFHSVEEVWPQHLSLEMVNKYNPDLFFVLHGNLTPLSLVREVRQLGVITCCWIIEDPYELDVHNNEWVESYNFIFTNELAVLNYYKRDHVYYLPWCTNPQVYKPQSVSRRYHSDLCFVGMGFKNRVELINQVIEQLPELEIKLIGDWERWGGRLHPSLRARVLPVVTRPEEVARYYNGARINMNIHRDPKDDINVNTPGIEAQSINNRTFDIAACRGFQLVDNSRQELKSFYLPHEEVVTFDNISDLTKKIRYYLADSKLCQQIAARAYLRTVKIHTFKHRLQRVFSILTGGD